MEPVEQAEAEAPRSLRPEDMRWCAGLPGTQSLPLSAEQRVLVQRMYRATRNRAISYAALGVLLLPGSFLLSALLSRSFAAQSIWPVAFAVLMFFFGVPVCIAKTIAQFKLTWPLRKDLERGVLWTFEGAIATAKYEDEDPDVVALVEQGVLSRGVEAQRIGVLPVSARLLHVNGRDLEPRRRLHVATTASSPQRLLRYSLPPDVKQAFGATGGLKRRRFSDAERGELGAHIGRLTSVPWTLFVLTGFMALTISLWIVNGIQSLRELLGAGWIVAWLLTALRHVRRYLLARRLEDDLEVGWLLSWETPESPARTGTPPFRVAEVLPISQMDWMIDGKPAAWRRVIQRAAHLGR